MQTATVCNDKTAAAPDSQSPAEALMARYKRVDLAEHGLFRTLRSRPFDHRAVWLVLTNLHMASRDVVRWLANLVANVDDDRIRAVLARQLYDESGQGDYERRHGVLFEQLLTAIEPWRPQDFSGSLLEPGRRLRTAAAALFLAPGGYPGIGLSMIGEIFAEQFDHLVGEQIRRQHDIPLPAWLTAHEQLEAGHVDDSTVIARLLPNSGADLEAAIRGADSGAKAFFAFLDELHELCFG
jgi:hypothetical protein